MAITPSHALAAIASPSTRAYQHRFVPYQLLVVSAFGATSSSSYALAETISASPSARWLRHGNLVLPCSGCDNIATSSCPTSTSSCCVHSTPRAAPRTLWLRRHHDLLVLAGCHMAFISSCALAATALPPSRASPAPPRALPAPRGFCIWRHQQLVVRSG